MLKRDAAEPAVLAVTDLILEVFRLNGSLLESGDRLVAGIGLTSARWQVLGAMHAAGTGLPVAHIARNMGLSRQAVQRLANEMAKDGLVTFAANPHHQRAKLVLMTSQGRDAYRSAMSLQRKWASELVRDTSPQSLETATVLLRRLRTRLEK